MENIRRQTKQIQRTADITILRCNINDLVCMMEKVKNDQEKAVSELRNGIERLEIGICDFTKHILKRREKENETMKKKIDFVKSMKPNATTGIDSGKKLSDTFKAPQNDQSKSVNFETNEVENDNNSPKKLINQAQLKSTDIDTPNSHYDYTSRDDEALNPIDNDNTSCIDTLRDEDWSLFQTTSMGTLKSAEL